MRRCLTTLFILLLFAVPLTAQEKLTQEQLEAIAIQPCTNWKETRYIVPEMLPLFKEETIQFKGKTMKFRLHVPENLEAGKKYPLILWLHGIGERGDCNELQLVHLHHIITSLTGEKKRDFFLLVPQHTSNDHWCNGGDSSDYEAMRMSIPADVKSGKKTLDAYKEELTAEMKNVFGDNTEITIQETTAVVPVTRSIGGVLGFGAQRVTDTKEEKMLSVSVKRDIASPLDFAFAMVEQTIENYPVDANRITLSGLSSGGDGTWRALERRPDLFAAAVPLVSWRPLTDAAMKESPILKKIPIWAIYSSDDNSIDRARAEFDRVEKAGANVRKTEFGICGHNAWTPAMLQADMFAWLLSRAKDGDRYYAVYDPGVDPDAMKGIIDVATRDTSKPTLAPAVEKQSGGTFTAATPTVTPLAIATPLISLEDQVVEARARAEEFGSRKARAVEPTMIEEHELSYNQFMEARARAAQAETIKNATRAAAIAGTRMEVFTAPDGTVHQRVVTLPAPVIPVSPERDKAYVALAGMYFSVAQVQTMPEQRTAGLDAFKNCCMKISPKARMELVTDLARMAQNIEALKALEEMLDGVPMQQPLIQPIIQRPVPNPVPAPARSTTSTTISATRIIEECDRPWAMTSESLYGMFPADWGKEAEAIPDFIVKSDSDALSKRLAKSVSEDAESKEFIAACRSILSLTNKPMSSPWFETSGGRLRSEIQYTLSQKGQMFVRFLRVVADSGGNSAKARELSIVAAKTLEKIEMVLAK